MTLIDVAGMTKAYGTTQVLAGVDLQVEAGEIVGILGPNGAGKTTLVECIGGLRDRDGGTVTVAGLDPAGDPPELRRLLGMQLQQCRLPAKMTTAEALDLFGAFYADAVPTAELLERFGLQAQAGTLFENLSGGQQQRLSVALALVGRPRIAILDELTTGLDPAARREIWGYLQTLRATGVTMLLVTHSMEEAAHLCDRVVIIGGGVVAAQGTPAELAADTVEQQTSFEADLPDTAIDALRALPGVRSVQLVDGRVVVDGDADSPQTVLAHLVAIDHSPRRLRVTQPTLDDAYLRITQHVTPEAARTPAGHTNQEMH